jgi:hypothetical protein
LLLTVAALSLPAAMAIETARGLSYGEDASQLASNGEMYGWIKELWSIGAQSEIGFRQSGTAADHEAAHYLLDKLDGFGFGNAQLEPVTFPHWKPIGTGLTVAADGAPVEIPASYMPYTSATPPQGVTAELLYAGRGLGPNDFDDAAGKIVIVDLWAPGLAYDTVFAPFTLFTYDPKGTMPGSLVTQNWPVHNHTSPTLIAYNRAIVAGAVGFIGVIDFALANSDDYYAPYDGVVKSLPGLYVSKSEGTGLKEIVATGPVTATLQLHAEVTEGTTYNVVASLPGATDEAILVTSHFDGWAVNDASGTSVVLGLAKYYSQVPPQTLDRTLVFILAGGHFIGDIPTQAFINGHPDLMESAVVNLNVEHIAAEVAEVNGKLINTGEVAPRAFFISGPPFGGNPYLTEFAEQAVERWDLERTIGIPANGPLGEDPPGISHWYHAAGIPIMHFISGPAVMFSPFDVPRRVAVDQLRPVTAAFVDIIGNIDQTDAALLE